MNRRWKEKFFASVVPVHGRSLLKFFVSRLPDASEAPDLVQEVYLRILRLNRPDLIRCPEAYLFTIAANLAREHALKQRTRSLHIALEDTAADESAMDEISGPETPEEATARAYRVRRLERLLAQVSPKARAALIWHRRDGLTYQEIGARLGVSSNMVKKYLAQALGHCRNGLATDPEG